MKMKKGIVLLSGGRDSFLSACLTIEDGWELIPVICNNGHMCAVNRAGFVVNELQKRYPNKIHGLVCLTTGMTLQSYMIDTWYRTCENIAKEYPAIKPYQLHCLACKSAMYVHGIAYAVAHGCEGVVDGMRKSQGFFVDQEYMLSKLTQLCSNWNLELITPVYELKSDLERKRQLCDRGLSTKTLEPQCYLGCPLLPDGIDCIEYDNLTRFYESDLEPKFNSDITQLVISMKTR